MNSIPKQSQPVSTSLYFGKEGSASKKTMTGVLALAAISLFPSLGTTAKESQPDIFHKTVISNNQPFDTSIPSHSAQTSPEGIQKAQYRDHCQNGIAEARLRGGPLVTLSSDGEIFEQGRLLGYIGRNNRYRNNDNRYEGRHHRRDHGYDGYRNRRHRDYEDWGRGRRNHDDYGYGQNQYAYDRNNRPIGYATPNGDIYLYQNNQRGILGRILGGNRAIYVGRVAYGNEILDAHNRSVGFAEGRIGQKEKALLALFAFVASDRYRY